MEKRTTVALSQQFGIPTPAPCDEIGPPGLSALASPSPDKETVRRLVLIYSAIVSLDGYAADQEGKFDWGEPDEEVMGLINDVERPISTSLYGRRMYEVLRYWEDADLAGRSAATREFAGIWRSADKVVYSTSLPEASTARTRIERSFDADAIRALKQHSDVSIGGPTLAAHAIKAGLVDEYQLFVIPVIVGGGLSALPTGARASLDLVDERRFASGVVYLRYQAGA
jgi:dihydrofolate reductase